MLWVRQALLMIRTITTIHVLKRALFVMIEVWLIGSRWLRWDVSIDGSYRVLWSQDVEPLMNWRVLQRLTQRKYSSGTDGHANMYFAFYSYPNAIVFGQLFLVRVSEAIGRAEGLLNLTLRRRV